jgi:hypothetical protein
MVATSINHSEIITLFEASRECVWLCRMVHHILTSDGFCSMESPTIIYEDNAGCVFQMEIDYVKTNLNTHMTPELFFPYNLHKNGDINILRIKL